MQRKPKTAGRSQSCDAVLTINGQNYNGKTGRDHGHAEIDALYKFIESDPGNQGTSRGSITYCAMLLRNHATHKIVSCPSRPCCAEDRKSVV